jgi:phosphoribosyl-ATP pyrophosphohydrolase
MVEFRTKIFPRGRLLTGNRREAVMATYKKDIEEILEVLVAAHNGDSEKTIQEEVGSGSFWDKT